MLRKILFFLFSFSLLLSAFAKNPSPARAATCNITSFSSVARAGEKPNDTDTQVTIKLSTGIPDGTDVTFRFKPPDESWVPIAKWDGSRRDDSVKTLHLTVTGGTITIENLGKTALGAQYYPGESSKKYKVGDYGLEVRGDTGSFCTISPGSRTLTVAASETGPDNYCTVHLNPNNVYEEPAGISFTTQFTQPLRSGDADDTNKHRFVLRKTGGGEWLHDNLKYPTSQMINPGVSIPEQLTVGEYRVQVMEHYVDGPTYIGGGDSCFSNYFLIGTEEDPGHECTADNPCDTETPNSPLSLPCPTGDSTYNATKGCTKIQTAVGVVGTGAPAFTRWVLGFILSISGGIVILIIIISGYRLMTSQGDPEKIKNARDQLTAAIVGLLFIIFSLVILQLITSDVLGLPGFGS